MVLTLPDQLATIRPDYSELAAKLTVIGPLTGVDLSGRLASEITLDRAIDGATTLTFSVADHDRALTRSGVFADAAGNLLRSYLVAGGFNFELASVAKQTDLLALTFEDAIVAALKRRTSPRVWLGGTATRTQIAKALADEAGVAIVVDPAARDVIKGATTRNEKGDSSGGGGGIAAAPVDDLTTWQGGGSGSGSSETYVADPTGTDTSWSVLGNLASDAGMRCYSDGTRLVFGSDPWLASRIAPTVLAENTGGVGNIDFTADVGGTDATATATIDAEAFSFRAGDPVTIPNLGPATGVWLISQWTEDVGRTEGTLTLTRARPALAESAIDPGTSDVGDTDFLPDSSAGTSPASTSGTSTFISPNAADHADAAGAALVGLSGRRLAMVSFALAQKGKPYVWGANGPGSWDCSGLVAGATRAAGKPLTKPARSQYAQCKAAGVLMSVEAALRTKGALLFRVNYPNEGDHVVISLGNGTTMEARGAQWGCNIFGNAAGRKWTAGALWV